jgi:hypothetical protein
MFLVISIVRRMSRLVVFDLRWIIICCFYIYSYEVYPAVKIGFLHPLRIMKERMGETGLYPSPLERGLFLSGLIVIRGIFSHDIADVVFHFCCGIHIP